MQDGLQNRQWWDEAIGPIPDAITDTVSSRIASKRRMVAVRKA